MSTSSPAASTATSVTSARPIISADAVEAVRVGLRIAFAAREPAGGAADLRRGPAEHARRAAARASSRASPRPRTGPPRRGRSRAAALPWRARRRTARPASARPRPPIVRTAATVLRSARSATAAAARPRARRRSAARASRGSPGAAREHRDHDADGERDDDRARREHRRRLRQVDAEGDEQRVQPLGERRGRGTGRRPTRAGRSRTLRAAPSAAPARAVAPSVRSVASSRVRWAIVIESVFAITKLPTNSATPANASRKSWMIVRKPLVFFVACLRLRFARAHLRVRRQQRADLVARAAQACSRAAPRSRSSRACPACRTAPARPGIRRSPSSRRRARTRRRSWRCPRCACAARRRARSRRSSRPPCSACVSAVLASIATSPGPDGHAPATSFSGLKRWLPCGCTLKAEAGGAADRYHLAVAPHQLGRCPRRRPALPRPRAAARTVASSDSENDGRRLAPPPSCSFAADRALAGDDDVGVLVDLREHRPERGFDRVGEDVGAADHRHARARSPARSAPPGACAAARPLSATAIT